MYVWQGLSGPIPASIKDAESLQLLDVHDNWSTHLTVSITLNKSMVTMQC